MAELASPRSNDIHLIDEIRSRVAARVGKALYERVGNLSLVAFPNVLIPVDSPFKTGYAMEKILRICNLRPRQFNPWTKFDVCINWQDLTTNLIDARKYIKTSYDGTGCQNMGRVVEINYACNDIGKRVIGQIGHRVFGYHLDVDPTTHVGESVCKSNENSMHNGEVVVCPIQPDQVRTNRNYSILVDNRVGDFVVDLRVICIGGLVDFFYEKTRPVHERFSNRNTSVAIRKLADEFTVEEVASLERFCAALGTNYGEMDVLRDAKTRRIYVVDFAKTPSGPPNGLPRDAVLRSIEDMSVAFINNLLKPLCESVQQ